MAITIDQRPNRWIRTCLEDGSAFDYCGALGMGEFITRRWAINQNACNTLQAINIQADPGGIISSIDTFPVGVLYDSIGSSQGTLGLDFGATIPAVGPNSTPIYKYTPLLASGNYYISGTWTAEIQGMQVTLKTGDVCQINWRQSFIAPGSTYPDPLIDNVVNIYAAYSISRQLRTGATYAFELREDSGNTLADIGFDSNGDINTAAIISHLAGANGFIRTIYDQGTVGMNLQQTTNANQAALTLHGATGLYCAEFTSASSHHYQSTSSPSIPNPHQIFFVTEKKASGAVEQRLLSSNSSPANRNIIYAAQSTNELGIYAEGAATLDSLTASYQDYPLAQITVLFNDFNSYMRYNRSKVNKLTTITTPGSSDIIGYTLGSNQAGTAQFWNGYFFEMISIDEDEGFLCKAEFSQQDYFSTP